MGRPAPQAVLQPLLPAPRAALPPAASPARPHGPLGTAHTPPGWGAHPSHASPTWGQWHPARCPPWGQGSSPGCSAAPAPRCAAPPVQGTGTGMSQLPGDVTVPSPPGAPWGHSPWDGVTGPLPAHLARGHPLLGGSQDHAGPDPLHHLLHRPGFGIVTSGPAWGDMELRPHTRVRGAAATSCSTCPSVTPVPVSPPRVHLPPVLGTITRQDRGKEWGTGRVPPTPNGTSE